MVWRSLMCVLGLFDGLFEAFTLLTTYSILLETVNNFRTRFYTIVSWSVLLRLCRDIAETQPISLDGGETRLFCSTRIVLLQMFVSHVVLLQWFLIKLHVTLEFQSSRAMEVPIPIPWAEFIQIFVLARLRQILNVRICISLYSILLSCRGYTWALCHKDNL